jgi:hypothetical protein
MKSAKIFCIAAVAVLLFTPFTAMARTHFNFSINLFDFFCPPPPVPVIVAPPPPPIYVIPRYPVPYYYHRPLVKQYHYHRYPREHVQEITPVVPDYRD